ncbi:MAG: hypothetical protein V3R87_06910, partial [Dehalococcoidia bacterium]
AELRQYEATGVEGKTQARSVCLHVYRPESWERQNITRVCNRLAPTRIPQSTPQRTAKVPPNLSATRQYHVRTG